jgi:hypothetical protein
MNRIRSQRQRRNTVAAAEPRALALEADRRSDGRGGARGPARGGLADDDGEQAARLNGRRRRPRLTWAAAEP